MGRGSLEDTNGGDERGAMFGGEEAVEGDKRGEFSEVDKAAELAVSAEDEVIAESIVV